ncbi:MAG TPA: mucoidy inhibitor MuiA family protein, partial [Opitutaceae bacterium]|nr:mucoidy inhibitor MuiA family protein [Opitutaceae bacterium]
MKALFFALALGLTPALHALEVNSAITAVTVYSDRAVVTRSAAVDVDRPETVEAVFARLPAGLQEASLHADGSGTAGATLLDVTGRPVYVDHPADERIRDLDAQLKQLETQQRQIDDDRAELKARRASLAKVESTETRPGDKQPRPTLEDLSQLEEFMSAGRVKIAAALRDLDQRADDLAAKREALQSQLSALRGSGGNSYKSVVVRFAAARAGRVELEVSYTVFGATWSPSYDARVSDAGRAVALGYFGQVRQSTGEDWKNVALTLSTARPSLGGSPPTLPAWSVDLYVPPVTAAAMDEYRDKTVKLSPFEVSADRGYYTAGTLSGTRINGTVSSFGLGAPMEFAAA